RCPRTSPPPLPRPSPARARTGSGPPAAAADRWRVSRAAPPAPRPCDRLVTELNFVSICFTGGLPLDDLPAWQLVAATNVAATRPCGPADRGRAARRQARGAASFAGAGAHLAAVLVPQRRPRAARSLAGRDRAAAAHGRPHRFPRRRRPDAQGNDPHRARRP